MTTERSFYVIGNRPAISKQHNELLAAFDLGITGSYVKFIELATITVADDVTDEQLLQQPAAIQMAFEAIGCIDVQVMEIE